VLGQRRGRIVLRLIDGRADRDPRAAHPGRRLPGGRGIHRRYNGTQPDSTLDYRGPADYETGHYETGHYQTIKNAARLSYQPVRQSGQPQCLMPGLVHLVIEP
jgi:hypothetical protein